MKYLYIFAAFAALASASVTPRAEVKSPQKGTLFLCVNLFIRSAKLLALASPAQASKEQVPSIPSTIYLTLSQQTLRLQPSGLPLLLRRYPHLTRSCQKLIILLNYQTSKC